MDERFQHLLAINRALAGSLDYEEVLNLVVEKTAQLLSARECALLLRGEDGLARVAASRGIPEEQAAAFAAPLDERINLVLRDLLSFEHDDTFLGVPVIRDGEVIGILVVHRVGSGARDEDEEMILAALADQTAIALDRARRYRQLWLESQRVQRELEAAAGRKDEFLAMLSHELRNPLAAIVNAISVLRVVSPDDPRMVRMHDAAARQTAHMKRLLDDLLDVSRVTRGQIELTRRPVSLQDLVQQALQGPAPLMARLRHQLSVELPPEPVAVEGDADRLVQVISNLVTNAAKYTDPGGRIEVVLTSEGEQAVLRVRDNGIGIPADLLPSVFDLFVQASRSADRSEGGLGIGLSLVKRLVEMHQGVVTAASAGPGQGSEFVVRLPRLAHLPQPPHGAGAAAARRPPAAAAVSPPRRILLVEDNEDVAELLAEALRGRRHQVTVAQEAEGALGEFERRRPEVVLIDIGLPGIDGYELARRLRARQDRAEPAPLLVAITGYGSVDDRRRAREAGFDHHLVKPVQVDQILRLLEAEPV